MVGKHRRDVTRPMAIMSAGTKVGLPEAVRAEVDMFLELVDGPSRPYMRSLGLGGLASGDARRRIRDACQWGAPSIANSMEGVCEMDERLETHRFVPETAALSDAIILSSLGFGVYLGGGTGGGVRCGPRLCGPVGQRWQKFNESVKLLP